MGQRSRSSFVYHICIKHISDRLSFRKTVESETHISLVAPISLFRLFSYKSRPTRFTLYSRARYRFVRVTTKARVCETPKKYSRPRCGFTFVSRSWQRRRLKVKRACLANISKTKCKLTRRTFGVYTTLRSRGS